MDDAAAVPGRRIFGLGDDALAIVVFGCVGGMQAIEDEAQIFVGVLLAVSRQATAAFPAALQHVHGTVAFVLFLPEEVGEDVVEGAGGAGFALAVFFAVAFGEVEGADDWVVDQGLEDHGHEAGLAHVVEASQTCGGAWCGGGVVGYESFGIAVL